MQIVNFTWKTTVATDCNFDYTLNLSIRKLKVINKIAV